MPSAARPSTRHSRAGVRPDASDSTDRSAGLPPYFQGVAVPSLPPGAINPATGGAAPPAAASPIAAQPTGAPANLAQIKPTDRARFLGMFTNAGPEPSTGLLAGDKARDILLKSKLPFDTLASIWCVEEARSG